MVRALACIGFAASFSLAVFAQSGKTPPTFGTVDIHASGPNTIPEMRRRFSRGRFELRNATMVDLIRTAWGVDADNVVGGPDWLDAERFDVIAAAPPGSTDETLNAMLRRLLEDRFQLVAHSGTKDIPAFVMTAGKKLQLKESDATEAAGCRIEESGNPPPPRGAPRDPVVFACSNITMVALANELPKTREASGYLFNYPVVDRTGLKGAFAFRVRWSPRITFLPSPAAGETITIFDAFEKQLGLKLELTKIPTPVVVVDSAVMVAVSRLPPVLPEFEVASIKPDAEVFSGSRANIQPGGRVRLNMTLLGLIQEAWDIDPVWIVGGPKSVDATPFVVVAKAPAEEDSRPGWNGPVWNGVDIDSMRKMLRALLMDRFKLAVHFEERPVSGYALVAAKPKLRGADPSNRPGCREGPGADGKDPRIANPIASRLFTCRNMTVGQFAAELTRSLFRFRPVIDSTGVAGRYEFTINFSPNSVIGTTSDGVASEPDGTISLIEALNKQLGLKLESRKVMAQVLVIDHVNDMPSEN